MDIALEFEKRKPWITKFIINGQEYGGSFDAMNDFRIDRFFQYFPNVRNILELGSLEGGHSFALANRPSVERVLAIEGRSASIERAIFVQELIGANKVGFVEANLEQANLADFGKFDAVFCSGLLYHFAQPWTLVNQCAQVSRNLFLWMHYVADENADVEVNGYRGKWYGEWGDPLSGLSEKSLRLAFTSLMTLLTGNGFKTIHIIENNLTHPNGPAIMLAAAME